MISIRPFSLLSLMILFLTIPRVHGIADDPAGRILDKLSGQTTSAPSVKIDFKIIMTDLRLDSEDKHEGQLILKSDKYRLNIMDTKSWFDGSSIYTYMPDFNELIISDPMEDGGLMSNPAALFRNYRENFNYRLIGEISIDGERFYEIDLNPLDLDQAFHTVKLLVTTNDYLLHSAVVSGKDGNRYTLMIDNIDASKEFPDSFFVFNESDYPDIEITDIRW